MNTQNRQKTKRRNRKLNEKQKTLKFPEFDDFHSTRDYVLAIKAFRGDLVKELQKRKIGYIAINISKNKFIKKERLPKRKLRVKIKMKLHQKFEEWHPKNLVDLLNFIKERYPIKFEVIMNDYDEMLMGN